MKTSDILLVLSALASGALSCATKPAQEATEVPAGSPSGTADGSCRHELGRCGGHAPGDGACRSTTRSTSDPRPEAAAPLQDVTLEPGKFAEINLEMGEGSAMDVEFHAGGPLEWNVHSHDGDSVVIHAEGVGADGTVRFAAPRAGLFSVLWKNTGSAPAPLKVRLAPVGSVRVHSVHPSPATGGTGR